MRRRRPGRPVALVAALLLLAAAGCAMAPPVRPTSIASGAVGGIYQPIAEAIARIARETSGLDLPLTVESTGASVANVQLLSDGKVQLALVQNDIAFYAAQGTTLPAFRGQARSNLRAILSIYPEFVHVVAAKASGITSVEGFRGKRVALGPEGSGTEQNALQLLEANGLKVTDLAQAERIDTAEAVTKMKAGQLDGAFFTVGAGSALVEGPPRRRDRSARRGAPRADRPAHRQGAVLLARRDPRGHVSRSDRRRLDAVAPRPAPDHRQRRGRARSTG